MVIGYKNYIRSGVLRLAGYSVEEAPGTLSLVNPDWRKADREAQKLKGQLDRKRAERDACKLPAKPTDANMAAYQQKMTEMGEAVEALDATLQAAKAKRKALQKRISIEELPEQERPKLISPTRKRLVDTLAMLAYRAETAQVLVLREHLARKDDARPLIQALYQTDGDLLVDEKAATLTVRLHRLANQSADKAVAGLLTVLNQTETQYPGTNLRLVYELVPSKIP